MTLTRRQMLASLSASLGLGTTCTGGDRFEAASARPSTVLHQANGEVDWRAVREWFPLAPDWVHPIVVC